MSAQPVVIAQPASGFMRQSKILETLVPVSSATLWRMVKRGTFPQPVKLSAGVTAWRVIDLDVWMSRR